MRFAQRLLPFLGALLLSLTVLPGAARQQGASCPALVQRALESVKQACGDLGRNSACYGNTLVEASFTSADVTFNQPADQTSVESLRTLRTFPLDETLGLWGVAVMNIQANVPDTLPGQGVKFVLYGDVAIQNRVEDTGPVCAATTNAPANIRSGPAVNTNVLTSVPAGGALTVTGRSDDGLWLAVTVNNLSGWISTDLATTACDPASLPVRTAADTARVYGPMQAFYFTTGAGSVRCNQLPPSSLVIQSPKGINVRLNANGLDISLGSTVALRATPGQSMQVATLSGKAVTREGEQLQVIPAGFAAEIDLGGDDGLTPVGEVSEPEPLEEAEWQAVLDSAEDIFDEPIEFVDAEGYASWEDFCADPANADACELPEDICADGWCEPVCGDLICDVDEDADICPEDCASFESVCGDFTCDLDEDSFSCPTDCETDFSNESGAVCGNFICEAGEDASTCPIDCGSDSSGNDAGDSGDDNP
ncbi:MAG: SH3 domain-containing protein [Chloroflexi bacterium]|nr:SH3 domain-containing protein [Chloroflexota bacterium]